VSVRSKSDKKESRERRSELLKPREAKTAPENRRSDASVIWRARRQRQAKNFHNKREAIIREAARLFIDQGFENTSLTEIGEALTVTKPTLYYYFKNKNEIVLEIKRRAQGELFQLIETVEKTPGSGLEKLNRLFPRYIEIIASDYGKCLVTIADRVLDESSRAEVATQVKEAEDRVKGFIQKGIQDGTIVRRPLKILYYAIFGMLNSIGDWYNPHGQIPPQELVEHYIGLLLDGLRRK
jgi:AcrR family transcriptional regulator